MLAPYNNIAPNSGSGLSYTTPWWSQPVSILAPAIESDYLGRVTGGQTSELTKVAAPTILGTDTPVVKAPDTTSYQNTPIVNIPAVKQPVSIFSIVAIIIGILILPKLLKHKS
jgi:hypothetical protein